MDSGKRIILLAAQSYQDMELWYPYYRMKEAGHAVEIASHQKEKCVGKFGYPAEADLSFEECSASLADAVIIPGGWAPDYIRRHKPAVDFVRQMFEKGKVVAAICHAGSVLVSAGILKGKKVTGYLAIRDDLINAGAQYHDAEVIVDGKLITSRQPEDLPPFCKEILKALG
ncbi:MAG: type 1 glutamine amidotransferase [Deltaproteobacteria bacterium]|nr:type 1 glutamine amidotransferase [Deltaproteobacteria bacterium]